MFVEQRARVEKEPLSDSKVATSGAVPSEKQLFLKLP